MRDYLTYNNSVGESVLFGSRNILLNENDARDYSWEYETISDRITRFKKKITSKKIPLIICGDNPKQTANELFDIIEKDVLNNSKGKLVYGDFFLPGYFIESNKKEYTKDGHMNLTLTFVSDSINWQKKTTYVYRTSDVPDSDRGLGYAYDYPYDYLSSINAQSVFNGGLTPANFTAVIYGPCNNPQIQIGAHSYKVNVEIYSNEYLTIDTLNKTIIKTTSRGGNVNCFANRDLNSYIFEPIGVGENPISINPSSDFDIVILEERSEPTWI